MSDETTKPPREKPTYRFVGDGIFERNESWWLDFRHQRKRHVVFLGKGVSVSVAREVARVKRAQVIKGEAGIGPKRQDVAFTVAADKFLAWAETNLRPKTVKSYRECLKPLKAAFGAKRLGEITSAAVEAYKERRASTRVAANRELAVLRTLYNRARGALKLYTGSNPAAGIKLFRELKGRLRFLEAEEEQKLLAAAQEPLRSIILVGLHAGLRVRAEALTLRQPDVDFARGLLTVQAAYAKNGHSRSVPMNRTLRAALAPFKERVTPEGYLFVKPDGKPYRSIVTAFKTACKAAGLGPDVTPHTLRHTFASRLVMAGVDLRTVQELGGWSDLRMVERYAHLSPEHKAEAVEKIGLPAGFTTAPAVDAGDRSASAV